MILEDQIRQISRVKSDNFRLLYLLSQYLNERADFVSADMVREVASVGDLPEEEAFLLLFAEACGIHPTDGGEDSDFFRNCLAPSVRCLDVSTYKSDPYYQHIHFPNVKKDGWEMRTDVLKPFQLFVRDDIRPDENLRELPPLGYFKEDFPYPVVLENDREWMLVTPNEVETIRPAIDTAHGKVVTFGLGLGYFPYMASVKPGVEQITVVERDPKVIALFEEFILPQFPCREKIRLVCMDAFDYLKEIMPLQHFNYAYADIWHDAGDGLPLYLRFLPFEEHFPGTKFDYWIEQTILSRLRWQDFESMPQDIRDPYRWLSNTAVRHRALQKGSLQ
ncbi:MAG: hypothetical protein IKP86_08065 [Anaerolineaceae bacterium]|nr:hypothetical protein [Anaerolineaceae bacterium]